jgi:hypothetical protein
MSTGIIHERPPARQLGLPNFAAELYWAIRCEIAIGCWRMSDALTVWAARMAGVGPRGG